VLELNETIEIQKIDEILSNIREKTSLQREKMDTFCKKRDALNSKINKLSQEIKQTKINRNKLNEKVKQLKEKRTTIQLKIKERISIIKDLRKKIEILESKYSFKNFYNIQKEFKELDWKIQTSTLELEEEKKLVERVRVLGTKISKIKKIKDQKLKVNKLQNEVSKLDIDAENCHNKLTEIAKKSQELHEITTMKNSELEKICDEANNIHKSYLNLKKEFSPYREESRKLMQRKNELLLKAKEKEEEERKVSEKILKEKIKSDAKAKIKNKQKLSWDEFKLLTESDQKSNK
jgi:uncharacterized coiled-coil DUF342 family protein